MDVTSNLVKTDVTALKIFKENYLLVATGQALYIYNISDNLLMYKNNIFEGQRIHGFVVNDNNSDFVVIYGGKEIKVCDIKIEKEGKTFGDCVVGNELDEHFILKDWIINVIWIENGSKLAVLTSHNVVEILDFKSDNGRQNVKYKCEEKCILYSGFMSEESDCIIVFGGTAFSQIIIWSTLFEQVVHRVTGHKGVIFSVSYNEDKNIIVSTSDDRSLRIWDVVKFSEKIKCYQYWKSCEIFSKLSVFGHTARVMQHKCVEDLLLSIGEDGLLCLWNLQGDLMYKRKVCQSGPIWCLDCDVKNKIIIMGCGDSSIAVFPLVTNMDTSQLKILDFKDLLAKRIVLTARGNVVCITEQGDVMYYNNQYKIWNQVGKLPTSKSYLCVSHCRQFIAVATVDGDLDIYVEPCKNIAALSLYRSSKSVVQGKLLSIHWVCDRHLVTCDEGGRINIHGPWGVLENMSFEIPLVRQRWLTAAALCPVKKQILIVGDKCGNLHVFAKGTSYAVCSRNTLHDNVGVNMIQFYDNKVVTTGRNGYVKVMALTEQNGHLNIKILYSVKVPFEWNERFIDKDMNILCGFRETNLIIRDMKSQTEILNIDCGGGHRSWDLVKSWFKLDNGRLENVLRFIYVKNSKVVLVDTNYKNVAVKHLSHGFHSKEVNCLKTIPWNISNRKLYLSVSGGEDTVVNLTSLEMSDKTISLNNELNINHLSSVKCVCLVRNEMVNDDNLQEYYLYSAGGRAEICLSKLQLTSEPKKFYSVELSHHMLLGTDVDRMRKGGGWSKMQMDLNIETRFMSLDCMVSQTVGEQKELEHFLLAGCSDGFLRIYKMSQCRFSVINTIDYHKKCILNVKSFKICGSIIAVTSSVDGSVAFWNFSSFETITNDLKFEPIYSKHIHKAGINAFDIFPIGEMRIALATGGDDNVFQLRTIDFIKNSEEFTLNFISEWTYDKYHCSQITGVRFCKNNIIVITSIDQRITVVRWCEEEELHCQFLTQYCSSIPDIQGLEILADDGKNIHLCVFGKGFELIDIKMKE